MAPFGHLALGGVPGAPGSQLIGLSRFQKYRVDVGAVAWRRKLNISRNNCRFRCRACLRVPDRSQMASLLGRNLELVTLSVRRQMLMLFSSFFCTAGRTVMIEPKSKDEPV